MNNRYTVAILFSGHTTYKYSYTSLAEAVEAYDFARSAVGKARYPGMTFVQVGKDGVTLSSTAV